MGAEIPDRIAEPVGGGPDFPEETDATGSVFFHEAVLPGGYAHGVPGRRRIGSPGFFIKISVFFGGFPLFSSGTLLYDR